MDKSDIALMEAIVTQYQIAIWILESTQGGVELIYPINMLELLKKIHEFNLIALKDHERVSHE